MNLSKLVHLVFLVLLTLSFTAQAELQVQNAQYKAKKNALYVKGKIKGDSVRQVYVLDARSNRQIGTINTTSGGQFKADISIRADQVPCMIKVQTQAPTRARFRRSSGDFTIKKVRNAPEECSS